MKTSVLTFIMILFFANFISAQPIPPDSLYLGQTPPGNTPVIFNLSINTGSFAAERIAISPDNKEIYYSEVHAYYPISGDTIKCYKYSGNHWTAPINLFQNYLAPGLTVSGDTMFFQNNSSVYQLFFSIRNGSNWSNPQRLLANLNSAHYLQVTNNGNYFISSIPDHGVGAADWCKLFINGTDTTAISLGLPVNSNGSNLDFFVSRDESFMILAKNGLRVSYHKNDGNWTNPKSLGSQINFGLNMWGPFVTSDDKYLFYTTGTIPDYSDTYIYWVRIDNIMDSLRYTNFIPYVKNIIPDQLAHKDELFTFTIPDTTFIDDDGNSTLTYSAKLTNGSPLPAWLGFDTITGTFAGTPSIIETLNIRVTATDTAGASVSTLFKINVTFHTSVHQINGQNVGVRIFPNPTNGQVTISFDKFKDKPAVAEISNLQGKVMMKNNFRGDIRLDLSFLSKGIYIVRLYTDNEIITEKICIK